MGIDFSRLVCLLTESSAAATLAAEGISVSSSGLEILEYRFISSDCAVAREVVKKSLCSDIMICCTEVNRKVFKCKFFYSRDEVEAR